MAPVIQAMINGLKSPPSSAVMNIFWKTGFLQKKFSEPKFELALLGELKQGRTANK